MTARARLIALAARLETLANSSMGMPFMKAELLAEATFLRTLATRLDMEMAAADAMRYRSTEAFGSHATLLRLDAPLLPEPR